MAETRETQVLEDVVESTEIENPRTTEEAILAQVISGDEVTINARTRLQKYLSQLTSGGASVEVESLNATENKTYTAPSGKAYSPVVVNVPNPNAVENVPVGTLGNPWGSNSPAELNVDAISKDINLILSIDASSLGFGYVVAPLMPLNLTGQYFNLSIIGSVGSNFSDWNVIRVIYSSGGASLFAIVSGNIITSDSQQAQAMLSLPAQLTIVRHPLPEDNT